MALLRPKSGWLSFFLLLAAIWKLNIAHGQLKVDAQIDAQAAISRLVGSGVRVSNVRVNCPSSQGRPYGYFTDNTGSLGLPDGLIITTGSASNAIGPNNSAAKSQKNNNKNQDEDLASIIQNNEKQFDACVVECDVEVFADTLVFDYVFGSEEYLEFIQAYHDVFGFFISGPGISGKVNLALVPGTNLPVSVKNINNAQNSQFYINNGTGATPFDNLFVQYDGFTKKLEAKIAVIPCQTYRLKMAICDVKDDIYDAGIFIGGKSLRTKAPKLTSRYQFNKFRTAIEGCNGVFVTLTRQSRVQLEETYQLVFAGTASPILDFGEVPTFLNFEAGEVSKEFFIHVLDDELDDDGEEIWVSVLNPCPGLPEVDVLKIPIQSSYEFDVPDVSVCLGDSVVLNSSPAVGYDFFWSPGAYLSCTNCPSPVCKPPIVQKYTVTAIEKESGCKAVDSLKVFVKAIPKALFTYEERPDYTNLDVFFSNFSKDADTWQWDFGDGSGSTEKNPAHYFRTGLGEDTVSFRVILWAKNGALGCESSDTAWIKIGHPFFIPNLITANGDGLNDGFFVRGIEPGIWNLEVVDSWGKTVYQSAGYQLNWKAENVAPGIYFFLLTNPPGDRRYHGWVQVLK